MRFSRVLAAGAVTMAAAVAAWQVSASGGSPVVRHHPHLSSPARGHARPLALGPQRLGTSAGPLTCAVAVAGCSLKPCVVFVQGGSGCPLGDRGPGIRPPSTVPVDALSPTPVRVP